MLAKAVGLAASHRTHGPLPLSFSGHSRGFHLFLRSSLGFEFTGAFLRNRDNVWVTQNFRK